MEKLNITTKEQAKKLVESLLEAYPDLMDKRVYRFTSHDGVKMYDFDEYYVVDKRNIMLEFIDAVSKNSGTSENHLYFSTQQAAQSYLDSLKPKPVLTTFDGVEVFEDKYYWSFFSKNNKVKKCTIASMLYEQTETYKYFSTESLAMAYQKAQLSIEAYEELVELMAKTGDCNVDYEDEIQIRHCIDFFNDEIIEKAYTSTFCFLAFKTKSIMQKFHKDNLQLIKQFYKH